MNLPNISVDFNDLGFNHLVDTLTVAPHRYPLAIEASQIVKGEKTHFYPANNDSMEAYYEKLAAQRDRDSLTNTKVESHNWTTGVIRSTTKENILSIFDSRDGTILLLKNPGAYVATWNEGTVVAFDCYNTTLVTGSKNKKYTYIQEDTVYAGTLNSVNPALNSALNSLIMLPLTTYTVTIWTDQNHIEVNNATQMYRENACAIYRSEINRKNNLITSYRELNNTKDVLRLPEKIKSETFASNILDGPESATAYFSIGTHSTESTNYVCMQLKTDYQFLVEKLLANLHAFNIKSIETHVEIAIGEHVGNISMDDALDNY